MEFEIITDQKGKVHLGFNKGEFDNDNLMGDKSSDFEFLKYLDKGGQGKVYKVCSLINHKIYAMKIIDLEIKDEMNEKEKKIKEDENKYRDNEIKLLKKLNHPNIVKYYKHFVEDNKMYIIMEYFDNGDLNTYIKVLKYLKKNGGIKKDELWNIFYQCMSGLTYLHTSNVAHRDIKPHNIFMTKNKMIKLGDFGVSAIIKPQKGMTKIKAIEGTKVGTEEYMAPEIESKKYNEKIDIFSMGCVFYELYFLKKYRTEDWERVDNHFIHVLKDAEQPNRLDDDLTKLIFKMLIKDEKERPDSKTIFKYIIDHYNKIFIKNSGLYSVLRCLLNLPYFNQLFIEKYKEKKEKDEKDNYFYSDRYFYFLENKNNWIENLISIKHKIIEENNFMNNNKEIEPYLILTFILDKLHGELNTKIKLVNLDSLTKLSKEEEVKQNYFNYFDSNFNSIISKNFVGHLETIGQCKKCRTFSYFFTYFFSLSFDLNFNALKQSKVNQIDLLSLFKTQNSVRIDLKKLRKPICIRCKKEEEHFEAKIFYNFPNKLIIYFDRGINCENKIKINYPEILDLSEIPKAKDSKTNYYLTGIIKRCDIKGEEHYISLIRNYSSDKNWTLFDNENIEKLNSPQEHNGGITIMLFYSSIN